MGGAKRVLVVVARQTRMTSYHLPMGIGCVSASLKRAGHEVSVLNPNHSTDDLEPLLERAIAEHEPDVLAVGGMALHLRQIRQVAKTARPLMPHGAIVVGGMMVTNQPEVAMRAVPEADVGIVGEGEHTTAELVSALASGKDIASVAGLVYRSPGRERLVQTAPRPIEDDLDALPWVDWEGLGLDVYAGLHGPGEMAPGLIVDHGTRAMPFLTSRGCPYPCTFCIHEMAGRRYRTRSLDDVFAELESAVDRYGIRAVCFFDDLFCLRRERLEEFCDRIRPLGLRWECSLRVEQVDSAALRRMRESGCVCISFGVESMSDTVLRSMRKQTTRERLQRALDLVYDAKITVWANLIFGDPAETLETATESLEWMAEHSRFDLRTAFIGYHPGSRIYREAVERNLIGDPLAYLLAEKPEINATSMSDEQYRELERRVQHHTLVFGMPGKLTELERIEDRFTIRLVCPHCGADIVGERLALDPRVVSRISCRYCNQLCRIPVKFRPSPSDKLRAEFRALNEQVALGAPKNKLAATSVRIVALDSTYEHVWTHIVEATESAGRPERTEHYLGLALMHANPYSQAFFALMDACLAKLGRDGERPKYARQAALLARLGVSAPTFVPLCPPAPVT